MDLDLLVVKKINERLVKAQKIVVVTHIRPDGDAIGSMLGFGLAIKEQGKNVQMVITDGVPSNFRYLPGNRLVHHKVKGTYDLLVVLDSSDFNRMGEVIKVSKPPDINIDHHITNENFADINLVIPDAASTAEILARLLPELGIRISQQVAENLLTGIVTDTIGFRTSNMYPDVLRLSADLMEYGVNLPDVYMKALNQRSFEAVRFWGAGLSRIERQGEMVWTTLTLADRKTAGYPGRDDADMINVLSTIEGASVNIIFVEQPNGKIKISWRCLPGYDVSKVAALYGGGGHHAAAGAEVVGNLRTVCNDVIKTTYKLLFNINN
jgi:phosphoesterase RecJ-like protein